MESLTSFYNKEKVKIIKIPIYMQNLMKDINKKNPCFK